MTTFGVVQFPGSCDDEDALRACEKVGDAKLLWHGSGDLGGVDAIVVPGGFSYGDYLRVGAIARFSPVMEAVTGFAARGGPVLGICNGFQVLCEAGLLPGALLNNAGVRFVCRQVLCEVADTDNPFTQALAEGEVLSLPIKHTTGRYYAPAEEIVAMEAHGQVVLRYADEANPNGSTNDIAGVRNRQGNVFGLMPHLEHAVEPVHGSEDGLKILFSLAESLVGV